MNILDKKKRKHLEKLKKTPN